MAITTIHPVKTTYFKCNNYITADKIKIDENTGEEIICKTVSSTLNCSLETANKQWEYIKKIHGKDNGNQSYHFIQSFDGIIDPYLANEIGRKIAEELFSDYQCIISTHTNTLHTHNHITLNSVSIADGHKYNDCLDTYRKIRQVSDRLCREYGLMVLESTKNFNLVKYKTDEGKVKYFEPTERKNQRQIGEYSNINDYRNTAAYIEKENHKKTNRDIIKADIDKLLPTVSSFEELLRKLREIGYHIKDKKADGNWRSYVSYKAPMQQKYTRDYMIDESRKYSRVSLTKYIESQGNRKQKADKQIINEIEQMISLDVRKKNQELNSVYNYAITVKHVPKEHVLKSRKSQFLLDRINADLRTIEFIRNKGINSFRQIESVVTVLYEKRNAAQHELNNIKSVLTRANETIIIIRNKRELESKIAIQSNDSNYINYEVDGDKALLDSYNTVLKQRKLMNVLEQDKFIASVAKYNKAYMQLSESLESVNKQIKDYDDCVNTIKYVDNEYDNRHEKDVMSYYKTKKEYESQQINKDQER